MIFSVPARLWLIVRQALTLAKFDDAYVKIQKFTYAVVFFGTPHRGTSEESLGTIAARVARSSAWRVGQEGTAAERSLSESLMTDQLFGDDLTEFLNGCLTNYQIVDLCETMKYLHLDVVESSSQIMEMSANPQ